jgi:rhodanese-related sulfurtransferase
MTPPNERRTQRDRPIDGGASPDRRGGSTERPDEPPTLPTQTPSSRSEQLAGRLVVGALLSLVALTVGYFALGMPGMDHSTESSMDGMSMDGAATNGTIATDVPTVQRVDPARFEEIVADADTILIAVHVPGGDEIEGTDLFMAFDDIDLGLLPADRGTPLAVYDRSGNVSVIALEKLASHGYTALIELEGGTNAWIASGRSLVSGS